MSGPAVNSARSSKRGSLRSCQGSETIESVFNGSLADLPKVPSNVVKIYLCSTRTDFELERELLWKDVLPELQHAFLSHGLDLQLVDVHQGALNDHAYDRHAFEAHLTEIIACHTASIGPYFLCLLGNKRGPVPLPASLEEPEFTHIRNEAFEGGKDVKLLDEWYIRDDNVTPAVYTLQPVANKFPHYNRRNPDNPSLQEGDCAAWMKVFNTLQDLLQHAATVCYKEGKIHQVHPHKQQKFFMSAVEQETQQALEMSTTNCLVLTRTFEDMKHKDEGADHYLDLKPSGDRDKNAEKRVKILHEILATKLNEKNKHNFYVPWKANGLMPSQWLKHADYLESFHNTVVEQLTMLIEKALAKQPALRDCHGEKKHLFKDIVCHSQHCVRLSAVKMRGLETTRDKVKKAILAGSNEEHSVIIVHGLEGCGKSLVLSKICQSVTELLGKDAALVVRYVGLTPMSQTSQDLLHSLCMQLICLLKLDKIVKDLEHDKLVACFNSLLKQLPAGARHSVIVIDGIENLRLSRADSQINLDWLGEISLPPKVHVLVSYATSAQNADNFNRLKGRLKHKDSLFEVENLAAKSIQQLVEDSLGKHKRQLTQTQEQCVLSGAKKEGCPLLVKLFLEESLEWPSTYEVKKLNLPCKLEDAVQRKFEQLQETFGTEVVAHVSRYMTASHCGLSEMEMLDLLSCNNNVLLHTLPGDLGPVLRFPHSLWIRIRKAFGLLIHEHQIDNKCLLRWSHRVVARVARHQYYVVTEDIKHSHKDIADLFLGTWAGNKPMVLPSHDIQIIDTGCRYIGPQPLLYSETKYNMRCLRELWYQLLHTGEISHFKEQSFCNFEYLLAKMHATSVQRLVSDLEMTCAHFLDAELHILLRCTSQSRNILGRDPLQLASELIGSLRQIKEYYPNRLEPLVQQCMEWCDSYQLPILVPLSSWLPDPREPLIGRMEMPDGVQKICHTLNSQHLFCTSPRNEIKMYNVPSKKLIKTLAGHRGPVTCLQMSHNNKFLVTGSSDSTLRIWDVSTGKNTQMYREHSDAILCLTITKADNVIFTGSKDKTFKAISLETGEVMSTRKEHDGPVTSLVLNNADSILVSGSSDGKVKTWYIDDMSPLSVIDDITSPIVSVSLSVDNTFLLISCEDKSVCVKSFTTGSSVHKLEGHQGLVESMVICKDSFHCVLGCSDGNVYIYNLRTTELLDTFKGHKDPVTDVCLSQHEHFIFSCSKDEVRVWTLYKRHTRDIHSDEHSEEVLCLAISADGKTAITGGRDKMVKLWNLDISDFSQNLEGHEGPVTSVSIADDEAFAVSGSEDRTVKVWSIMMGCIITDYLEHQSTIEAVYVLPDSTRVLSAESAGITKLWSAEDGSTYLCVTGPVLLLEVSPNRQLGISGDVGDLSVKIWNVEDGTSIQTINHSERITCMTFSKDSQYLVTGSTDKSLKVWEAPTGKLTQVLVEHDAAISCVAVTESNRHVISGSHDQRLMVWGLSTGAVEQVLIGHTDVVTCVKVTSDGSTAISGSKDGTLHVWNVNTGTVITVFDMHQAVVDILTTGDAAHVVVKLKNSRHIPLMCLHNSPAGEIKSQSQIDIELRGDSPVLPIRPKPLQPVPRSMVYTQSKKVNPDRQPSVSSIPEIIKVSPIRAPLQKAIKAQKQNKESREHKVTKDAASTASRKQCQEKKSSSICSIL